MHRAVLTQLVAPLIAGVRQFRAEDVTAQSNLFSKESPAS